MPPPTARQKAAETDIFKLDATDICTLALHPKQRIRSILENTAWRPHISTTTERFEAKVPSFIRCEHTLRIFIDESGSFTGYHTRSISAVGALAIPDGKLDFIEKKYAKIRTHLPIEKGQVKGRLLNEQQVNEVVTMLSRNNVLFEIAVVDLGFHNETDVQNYKQQHLDGMLARV
jgi:hypothetical protein